jgi:hypothetical protein
MLMPANEMKSSDTTKKWLIGCGIGCGAIILILIILGAGGYFFFRNMVEGFRNTEAMMSTLTERFGRIEDFCPDPDGAIKPERIEAFLSVRDAFAPARQKLEMSFEALKKGKAESEIEVKKSRNVIKMISLGFGLIPQISELLKSRNQALLDKGMGMGEYYFIYAISYYSWLKKSPEDGPDVQLMDFEERGDYRDRREWLEVRRDLTLKRVNRQILPMLSNQLKKLAESDKSGVQAKWRKKLEAEVKAMESDRDRIPWQESLPSAVEASFRPFKERLEATYSIMTNSLEMTIEQRERVSETKKQNSN